MLLIARPVHGPQVRRCKEEDRRSKMRAAMVGEAVAPLTQVQDEVGKERSKKLSNNLSELKNVKPRVVSRSHEPQSIAANQR